MRQLSHMAQPLDQTGVRRQISAPLFIRIERIELRSKEKVRGGRRRSRKERRFPQKCIDLAQRLFKPFPQARRQASCAGLAAPTYVGASNREEVVESDFLQSADYCGTAKAAC